MANTEEEKHHHISIPAATEVVRTRVDLKCWVIQVLLERTRLAFRHAYIGLRDGRHASSFSMLAAMEEMVRTWVDLRCWLYTYSIK